MSTENEELKDELNSREEQNENSEPQIANQDQQEKQNSEPTAEEKYAELNDRFIRLYAEFENFRRRSNKERLDVISSANAGLLKDLLPVLDDFERAITNNDQVTDIEIVKEGFGLIQNKFKSILDSKGLKEMNAKGEPFDSELHEAIANIPVSEDNQKGKVIDDIEKGYYLNDKVIRFAKVVVGQ
ncbi:MAG: nucleotide exchange factor GrpE [Crocinitomicaceae bacterium]